MEICRDIGAHLLDTYPDLKVDVHHPQVRIWIEVRDRTYIYSKAIKGLGGMPVGSNGRAMLLLSGGIDSPVAGYMIANVVWPSMQFIFIHILIRVNGQKKKLSIWHGLFHVKQVPFVCISFPSQRYS